MTTADRSLTELLRGVRRELDSASGMDTVSLARPRAKLAWIASLLPDQRPAPRRLLDLAAEVVSAIGLDDRAIEPDHQSLVATRAAVTAVEEYLRDPAAPSTQGVLAEAGQQLMRAVGRNPTVWLRSNVEWIGATTDHTSELPRLSLERLRTPRTRRDAS
jgi:hypothetical protein